MLGESLIDLGYEVDTRLSALPCTRCELRYAPPLNLTDLAPILAVLSPIAPQLIASELVGDGEIVITLGSPEPFSQWELRVYGDSDLRSEISEALMEYGFQYAGIQDDLGREGRLVFGAADPFARQLIRWLAARYSVHVQEEQMWDRDALDVHLYLPDPNLNGDQLKSQAMISLEGDDLEDLQRFQRTLEELHFNTVRVCHRETHSRERFSWTPGVLARDPSISSLLESTLISHIQSHEINLSSHPLLCVDDSVGVETRVILPLARYRSDQLRPYVPSLPAYWDVKVYTESPESITPLIHALNAAGFMHIETSPLDPLPLAIEVLWPKDIDEEQISAPLLDAIQCGRREIERGIISDLSVRTDLGIDSSQIKIRFPISYLSGPAFHDRILELCQSWALTIKLDRAEEMDGLISSLRGFDFKQFTIEEDESSSQPFIQYGGAPAVLVEFLSSYIFDLLGVRCQLDKSWSETDRDIWISLPPAPPRSQDSSAPSTEHERDLLQPWFPPPLSVHPQAHPLLRISEDTVQFADLTLSRRRGAAHRLTPQVDAFRHYCLDQRTAESLYHIAETTLLQEPCLLEGETSVSKTSVIQYLAMILNQPLLRLNLNGQTDTGELVGRFLPQGTADELPLSLEQLIDGQHLLNPQTQRILSQASTLKRDLNAVEIHKVITAEELPAQSWRWRDGALIEAMRSGWWVILDELNLAEPQILERLNSLLERSPSLVLTEYDHRVFGRGGEAIHPQFRIFATMNPAEYAGRSQLSPAYRDRWSGYRYVPRPREEDYQAMLRYLVFGHPPTVSLYGVHYVGLVPQAPPFSHLSSVPKIDSFLSALARFHHALELAVDPQAAGAHLGGRRRERYVFTRRGLLSVMAYLAHNLRPDRDQRDRVHDMRVALCRYYLNRVTTTQDREIVLQLLEAVGLGVETWSL